MQSMDAGKQVVRKPLPPGDPNARSAFGKAATKEEAKMNIKSDTRQRTTDVQNRQGIMFEDMGLKDELLMGIYEMNYEAPSPIQELAIPKILTKKNVIGRAKNGTGKTMAYGIPVLEIVDSSEKYIQAVILVSIRELALQVARNLKDVGKHMQLQIMCIMGGDRVADDTERLRGVVHIVVCTPGRLKHFIEARLIDLSHLKLFVMDEADQLLRDSPASDDTTEYIIQQIPADSQRLLFSASFPRFLESFCSRYVPGAELVNAMDELVLIGVTQYYIYLEEREKLAALIDLFSRLSINQCMIFCNNVPRAIKLSQRLNESGYTCFCMHSGLRQDERNRIFDGFRKGQVRNLVCTDLLTRGVDVESVNVVVNFDFPRTSVQHLHRVGRSGRFGHLGLAINLVTERDRETFFRVEKELQVNIDRLPDQVDKNIYQ